MEDHVLAPLHMEILFYILTNHLDLALRSLPELVNDQVRVVSTEVVEEDRDSETDRALQVALAVSGADEESSNVIMVSDLRLLRIVLLERVAADVTLRCVLVFLLLLSAYSIHRSIGLKLLEDRRFPR